MANRIKRVELVQYSIRMDMSVYNDLKLLYLIDKRINDMPKLSMNDYMQGIFLKFLKLRESDLDMYKVALKELKVLRDLDRERNRLKESSL